MPVFSPFRYFLPLTEVGFIMVEAQSVVALRMFGMAGLWSVTPQENQRMVQEKVQAMSKATLAA